MATKSDVRLWVDKVEKKAIKAVNERFDKVIQAEQDRLIKENGLDAVFKKINRNIASVYSAMKDYYSLEDMRYQSYFSCNMDKINQFKEAKADFIRNVEFGGNVQKMIAERNEAVKKVEDNYRIVKRNIDIIQSGNKCVEYLKDLGFDISDLETSNTTALAEEVDTRFLFVCGERK